VQRVAVAGLVLSAAALLTVGAVSLVQRFDGIGLFQKGPGPTHYFPVEGPQQATEDDAFRGPTEEPTGGTPASDLLDTTFIANASGQPDLEMDRFAKISGNNNYRSARIHSKEQLAFVVEKYNLRHVVNLALDSMTKQQDRGLKCSGMNDPCEPLWAAEVGVQFHSHYLTNQPPEAGSWRRVRQLLEEGDVLLHCTHGVDRTGAVVARWERSQHPQLTDEELQEYTYAFGGQWKLPGRPNRHLEAWMLEEQ
jgi:hypothetical protein